MCGSTALRLRNPCRGPPLNPPRVVLRSTHIAALRPPVADRSQRFSNISGKFQEQIDQAPPVFGAGDRDPYHFAALAIDSHPSRSAGTITSPVRPISLERAAY